MRYSSALLFASLVFAGCSCGTKKSASSQCSATQPCPSGEVCASDGTCQALAGPAAPTSVMAIGGKKQVTLTWTASSGATGYDVQRGDTTGGPYTSVGMPTTTSFDDTSATAGTKYYYVVFATSASGKSTASTEVSALTIPDAPAGLTATGADKAVGLTWTASKGADSYEVDRDGEMAATVMTTSAMVTGLDTGMSYTFTVRAQNASGASDPAMVSALTVPAAPVLTATGATGEIDLSWTASASATVYHVQRGMGGSFAALADTMQTTYSDTTATPGTAYDYVVTATNASGTSAVSNTATATATAGAFGHLCVTTSNVDPATTGSVVATVSVAADGTMTAGANYVTPKMTSGQDWLANALAADLAHGELLALNEGGMRIETFAMSTLSSMAGPTRTITGSNTLMNHETEMQFDPSHDEIFTMNNSVNTSDTSILVFDRTATGNIAPKRVLTPDRIIEIMGIAIDVAHGELWVATEYGAIGVKEVQLRAYDASASGMAMPLRTINLSNMTDIWRLAYDPVHDQVAAIVSTSAGAQELDWYARMAGPNDPPVRSISGSNTMVDYGNVRLLVDPVGNRIFLLHGDVVAPSDDTLVEFPLDGNGNIAPISSLPLPQNSGPQGIAPCQ